MSIMPISDRLGRSRRQVRGDAASGVTRGRPQMVGPVVGKLEKLEGDLPLRSANGVRACGFVRIANSVVLSLLWPIPGDPRDPRPIHNAALQPATLFA